MFQNPFNPSEVAPRKSSAPKKAAKKVSAPVYVGPMQPAFGVEDYLSPGGPWAKIMNNEMPLDIPPMVQVPEKPVPPMQIANSRIASDIREEASPYAMDYSGSVDNKLMPTLGNQMLRRVPIGNKPGEEGQSKIEADQKSATSMKMDRYMPEGQYGGLAAEIENLPIMQERRRSIYNAENAGRSAIDNMPVGVDLSPLMAYGDRNFGTKLMAGYKPPMNYADKIKEMTTQSKLAQELQGQNLQDVLKSTQYLKAGSTEDQAIRSLAEVLGYKNENLLPRNAVGRPASGRGNALDAWKVIQEGGKISKEVQDNLSALTSAEGMLASGDYGSVKRALSIVARSVSGEKGVLTEQDVGRILTNTLGMDAIKIQAYLTSDPNIKVPAKTLDSIMQDLRSAKARIAGNGINKLNAFNSQLIPAPGFSSLPTSEMLQPQMDAINKAATSTQKTNDEKETENFMKMFNEMKSQKMKAGSNGK